MSSQPLYNLEQPEEVTAPAPRRKRACVSARAVIIALILAVINDYWIVQLEVVRYSFPTYAAPYYNCIFTLLVVTGLNFILRKRCPRLAVSGAELIAIYVVVSITSSVCSINMMQALVSMMGYPHFFASPENGWGALFLHRLPTWLTVSDHESLHNFYYGNSTLYSWRNLAPWIVPALCWSAFCAVLLYTMLCLNSILRKHWVESERLAFPIVQLPLEMVDESAALFRNRYMWLGFALAGTLTLLAGLNYLYPSVPYLRIIRRDVGQYVVDPPWSAMGGISVGFYMWAIGLAFVMPLELSFSCWFFFWLMKLELVACRAAGMHELTVPGGGFDTAYPFINAQGYGAYLGFFVMSMWGSRRYLARVFRTAFMGTREEDESAEAMSYRKAILGACAGFCLLGLFAYLIGMTIWVIAVFFLLVFIMSIVVSRIRAELGFPVHDMNHMFPQEFLTSAFGTPRLAAQDFIGITFFSWFNGCYASHPSPQQIESLKLAERTRTSLRSMFNVVLIAGTLAMPIGFWMLLHNYYQYGGATARMEMWALGLGKYNWGQLESWLKQPLPPNPTAMGFVGAGFIVSALLGFVKSRFFWFPFHPLAYALSGSWGVSQLWMPLLIGWAAKFVILKFGGLKTYRKALPFFLGLILGEIAIGSLWTILGIVLGTPTYDFWPGKYS